jgi:alpha-beta hydrolase superfamily lysophospholipase
VLEITDSFQDFAEKIAVPVHISGATDDKLTTISSIKKFTDRLSTPADKKVFKEYEGEHYIIVDGNVIDEIIKTQYEWLNTFFSFQK